MKTLELSVGILWGHMVRVGIAPLLLTLGTRWGWVVSLTPHALRAGYSSMLWLSRGLGGPLSLSGCLEKGNVFPLVGIEPWFPCCTACMLVAILTALSCLLSWKAYHVMCTQCSVITMQTQRVHDALLLAMLRVQVAGKPWQHQVSGNEANGWVASPSTK
jgi:hypothetical protein